MGDLFAHTQPPQKLIFIVITTNAVVLYISMQFVRNGWEKPQDKNNLKTSKEEIERISISRTRRNIKELALSNQFDWFVTFTLNSKYCDRYALDECQAQLRKFLKFYKRKSKDFAYLFITEKHKDGAFHFHGLLNAIPPEELYTNEHGYFSLHRWSDTLGFNSLSKIANPVAVSHYILKYITKDCVRNAQGTVYISSRGLKKAEKYEIQPFTPPWGWNYTNDFCKISDYQLSECSTQTLLALSQIQEINCISNHDFNINRRINIKPNLLKSNYNVALERTKVNYNNVTFI